MIQQVIELSVAPVAFLLMLVIGLSVELPVLLASFRSVRRLSIDLFLVIGIPPVAALLVVMILQPSQQVAAAILLIGACPVGDIANAYTLLARGSVARSLCLNLLTSVMAPISMLLIFGAYSKFGIEHGLSTAPLGNLAMRLTLLLVLPVLVGMALRSRMPHLTSRVVPVVARLTTLGILLLLVLILLNPTSQPRDLQEAIWVSAVFLVLCAGITATFLRRRSAEKTALALSVPVRNVGIGAFIAVSLLGEIGMLGLLAVYFTLEVVLFLPLSYWLCQRAENSASL
ncbi:MAG: hypothetical protein AB8D78_05430 [Akkermansiaceae bacterium]